MTDGGRVECLLRDLAPQVLDAVRHRFGGADDCEDSVQEACFAAFTQWPTAGVPDNPKGWLITTAARRRIEMLRSQSARDRREQLFAQGAAAASGPAATDDTLALLLLCCHPSLTRTSQVTLTLRVVGGLSTAEIASGLLLPETTVAQRISRAKQRIKASETGFRLPGPEDMRERITSVLDVLYLIFNEGYTASSGPQLHRPQLTAEAIAVARQLYRQLPRDGEITGLLALMLLTDARRPGRTSPDGGLVPLAEQDRSLWDAQAIAEGTALVSTALAGAVVGPFQLQAAIAAVHDEADGTEGTDWLQILGLYTMLRNIAPSPMVTLNRIVAVAMVRGPGAALSELDEAMAEPTLAAHYRSDAVRAHLLELDGNPAAARDHYLRAARRTLSHPEQTYLRSRAAACGPINDCQD